MKYHNKMGNLSSFVMGMVLGVYLDQTHKMPNVEKWVKMGIRKVKEWEEYSRK